MLGVVLAVPALCVGAWTIRTWQAERERQVQHTIPAGSARTASARIIQHSGDLTLAGGAGELLDAAFTYNRDVWQPDVTYTISDTHGTLAVAQSGRNRGPSPGSRYQANLRLGADLPLDLTIDTHSVTSTLQLGGLPLQRAEISVTQGRSVIDLRGAWRQNTDLIITNDLGDITLRLPRDVGVRVKGNQARDIAAASDLLVRGSVYTNAAYGVSPISLYVDVTTYDAHVRLE